MKLRILTGITAAALALSSMVVTPTTAVAAESAVDNATFEWALNGVSQVMSHDPTQCHYFSASHDDATQASYKPTNGNVSIVTKGATPTWANKCALNGSGQVDQKVVFSGGTGTVNVATDSASIQFTGQFAVHFYGDLPYTIENPVLSLTGGTGTIKASGRGYHGDRENPDAPAVPTGPFANITVAELSGVNVTTSGFTVTPKFKGVTAQTYPGADPQTQIGDNWGSWPQSWLDFHNGSENGTGLTSYWYSTGVNDGAQKAPKPISIGFSVSEPQITGLEAGIGGTVQEGATVTATAGNIEPAGATLAYEWFLDSVKVGSAKTYTIPKKDVVGKQLTVQITASATEHQTVVDASDPATILAKKPMKVKVKLDPKPVAGQIVTANATSKPLGAAFTYQWNVCGQPLAGQTSSSLTIDQAVQDAAAPCAGDRGKGKSISVTVKATQVGYPDAEVTSKPAAIKVPK